MIRTVHMITLCAIEVGYQGIALSVLYKCNDCAFGVFDFIANCF